MTDIANWVGGADGIGWAIIILTAIIRLILLPIFINQQRNTTISGLKMQKMRPELEKIQAAAKAAQTPTEQQAISMQSMNLYRENNVSMTGGVSWLTMAVQLPIFSGLYLAIKHADGLKSATFYGMALSKPQIILTIIVFLIYVFQAYLSQLHMPEDQKKTAGKIAYFMPVMIAFFTFASSGAIGLYFIVGGISVAIQTLVIHFMHSGLTKHVEETFSLKRGADELLKEATAGSNFNQGAQRVRPEDLRPRDVTPTETNDQPTGQRNAGKQNRQLNKE
ncbi:membrane protein oxaA 2 [Fructobacillus ficulneus]|uniref:Membrane protein oxaA 2 n=1 Tax=Fructobacillus ficulneus TaxID=157463 RepID=A0A0K8MGR0_9LACO|nr:membrane protein oxaA 2 [Fructobacillus ficulneus]